MTGTQFTVFLFYIVKMSVSNIITNHQLFNMTIQLPHADLIQSTVVNRKLLKTCEEAKLWTNLSFPLPSYVEKVHDNYPSLLLLLRSVESVMMDYNHIISSKYWILLLTVVKCDFCNQSSLNSIVVWWGEGSESRFYSINFFL